MIGFISCKKDVMPTDVNELKTYLKTKKSALKILEKKISEIEDSIKLKDPNFMKLEKLLVTLDTIKEGEFLHYQTVQASVESEGYVPASSQIGGNVIVYVEEGKYVSKGALIAKVDSDPIMKQMEEVQKGLELANQVFERQSRLWEQKIGTEIQYLQAKNSKERLEKTLETIKVQLKYTKVYAPIGGLVDKKLVESGENVAPGMPIIQILDERDLKVVANVAESYLGKIKVGNKLKITFPALNKEMIAAVTRIGASIDPINRTYKVEIKVPNSDKLLKPNLLATVDFKDYENKKAITVQSNLIQEDVSGEKYLAKVTGLPNEPKAEIVFVETGDSFDGKTVIQSGLVAGDIIIVNGAKGIKTGDEIKF